MITIVDGRLRWGWHGDLDERAGRLHAPNSPIYRGADRDRVADAVGRASCRQRPASCADPHRANALTSHLSYWTDNGAAYWYRTEPGRPSPTRSSTPSTALRADDVPIRAVELDSWFYQHETSRPIDEIGYPHDVPPSGAGCGSRGRTRSRPATVATATALTSASPTSSTDRHSCSMRGTSRRNGPDVDPATRGGSTSSPRNHTIRRTSAAGSTTPRARAPPASSRTGCSCTGSACGRCVRRPAGRWPGSAPSNEHGRRDRSRPAVVHGDAGRPDRRRRIRAGDRGSHVRRLPLRGRPGDAVDVVPHGEPPRRAPRIAGVQGLLLLEPARRPTDADAIDGDVHAELEALLSAMSAGPVGHRRPDRTDDRDIVMRTCDADGRLRLVRPPDRADRRLPVRRARAGRAVGLGDDVASPSTGSGLDLRRRHQHRHRAPHDRRPARAERHRARLDRTACTTGVGRHRPRRTSIEVELGPRDWALFVCCPIVDGTFHVGDRTKYVTIWSGDAQGSTVDP